MRNNTIIAVLGVLIALLNGLTIGLLMSDLFYDKKVKVAQYQLELCEADETVDYCTVDVMWHASRGEDDYYDYYGY